MTQPGFPRIAIDPAICAGRPIIAGTRVCVTDVLDMLASGASIAEITDDFPYLIEADVLAALAYGDDRIIDDATLSAILSAEPGERSKAAGLRLADPDAS